jgi:integrase
VLTGRFGYAFPGQENRLHPMSDNTINKAPRNIGYRHDEMTGHGFRGLASTLLNEQGWGADAIERQSAHNEKNEVRGAYNYADHIQLRRKMLRPTGTARRGIHRE